jgi:hypothetical protein
LPGELPNAKFANGSRQWTHLINAELYMSREQIPAGRLPLGWSLSRSSAAPSARARSSSHNPLFSDEKCMDLVLGADLQLRRAEA